MTHFLRSKSISCFVSSLHQIWFCHSTWYHKKVLQWVYWPLSLPLSRPCCSKICLINTPSGTSCPGIPPPPGCFLANVRVPLCRGELRTRTLAVKVGRYCGRKWGMQYNGARHSLHSTVSNPYPPLISPHWPKPNLCTICVPVSGIHVAPFWSLWSYLDIWPPVHSHTSSLVLFWICMYTGSVGHSMKWVLLLRKN